MIVFRGKNEEGRWVYGSLRYYHNTTTQTEITKYFIIHETDIHGNLVVFETIGHSFGVTDRNTFTIYTDDILKNTTTDELFVVKYNQLHCCFGLFDRTNQYKRSIIANPYMNYRLDDYIKIGNIHDNPELLEGKI